MATAVNKLAAFRKWKEEGVSIPPFWTRGADVVRTGDDIILCRTLLSASQGAGITVARADVALIDAPLYVKYLRKKAEYRMHVLNGRVIFTQQKRRKQEAGPGNADQQLIRNHDNGWVFAINNITFTSDAEKRAAEAEAIKAVTSLGLDFGAVDLIVPKARNAKPVILEVNTAPGIESPTLLDAYTRAFREVARE